MVVWLAFFYWFVKEFYVFCVLLLFVVFVVALTLPFDDVVVPVFTFIADDIAATVDDDDSPLLNPLLNNFLLILFLFDFDFNPPNVLVWYYSDIYIYN